MKKLLLILLTLSLFSCEDFLVESPKSIAVETFYNTKTEVESAIAAAYSPLRPSTAYGSQYISLIECNAEYWWGRGSWANTSDFQGYNTTNIGRTDAAWNQFYLTIRNANLVIKNTPSGKQLTEGEKAKFVAEGKFVRAFTYFQLVKNWGGVPKRTEENFTEIEVGRSSADDIYALILSDLQDAETNLPDAAPLPGRASKWAAKTLLADVYFFLGQYSQAAGKANEVISANKYSLVPVATLSDFSKIFGPETVTSSEEIFYIKYSHENGSSYPMMHHHPASKLCGGGGWYAIYTDSQSNSIMKNWDQNDLRRQLWHNQNIGLGPNTLLTSKIVDPTAPGSGSNATDVTIYRYADILLLSAEAEVRSTGNVTAAAMEKVNMVHRRAYGYPPLASSAVDFKLADYNKDTFADLVMTERCYEKVGEGSRWHDLKRLGNAKVKEIIKANTGKDVADKHFLWPIPVNEMNYNKKIDPTKDQNPGY